MKLSVIIPTKDRKQVLERTVAAAMSATSHIDSEIIVVNDSKIHTVVLPASHRLTMVDNPGSGVASARNFGFKHATGELILFLDNDIIISRESVERVLLFHSDHDMGCLNLNWEYTPETLEQMTSLPFTRFLKHFKMISFKGWYADESWRDNELFRSTSVASFHLSISRKNFVASGGYDERFPFAGFEDYDFPVRLRQAGLQFFIDSSITVYHNEIDRLDLDNWLLSQENRASTRRRAVALGYGDVALSYSRWKRFVLDWTLKNEVWVRKFLAAVPNSPATDPISFKVLSVLQASRIYRGYTLG